jgi:hypothetical protein
VRGLAFRVAVGAALCAAGPSRAQKQEQPGPGSRSIAAELGLPAVSLSFLQALDNWKLGARVEWERISRAESFLLSAVGARGTAGLLVVGTARGSGFTLQGSAGVRRLWGNKRDASCNCVQPLPAATSFQAPIEADARWAVSETAALTFFAALGIDLLGSGASGGARTGVILSPQGGVAFDVLVSPRFALGIEARTGMVAVPDASFQPAVLAGRSSFAMPLDLALRFALDL